MKLKAVPLAIFIVISMTACGDSKPKEDPNRQVQVKNDYYSSKEDCIKDWGKEDYCKPESDRPYSSYMSSSSSWSGIGSSSGSTGSSTSTVASATPTTPGAPTSTASTGSGGGGGGFYAYGFHGPTYYQNGSSGSRAFTDTTGNVIKAKSNNASRFVTSYAKAGDIKRIHVPSSVASKLSGGETSKTRVDSIKHSVKVQSARSSGSRGFFSGGRASSGG